MRQIKLFILCWLATYGLLWAAIGEAAIVSVTFFAATLYVPVSVLDLLRRRAKLHFIGYYFGCWGGELFLRGEVVPRKRPRGRPRKDEVAA